MTYQLASGGALYDKYEIKDPEFENESNGAVSVDKTAKLKIASNNLNMYGTVHNIIATVNAFDHGGNVFDSQTFTFSVTFTYGDCVSNPTLPNFDASYEYILGQPKFRLTFDKSTFHNGDCPFTSMLHRQSATTSIGDEDIFWV